MNSKSNSKVLRKFEIFILGKNLNYEFRQHLGLPCTISFAEMVKVFYETSIFLPGYPANLLLSMASFSYIPAADYPAILGSFSELLHQTSDSKSFKALDKYITFRSDFYLSISIGFVYLQIVERYNECLNNDWNGYHPFSYFFFLFAFPRFPLKFHFSMPL